MALKTTNGITTLTGEPDPQLYVYVADKMRNMGRTAYQVQMSIEHLTSAVRVVTASIHKILEEYYFNLEAETRWEDDGGPCFD